MPAAPPRTRKPSLRVERALQRAGHRVLAGMDEVGRGALAGPVTVGVVLIDETCRSAPVGVRDSKLLTPAARQAMVPKIQRWCLGYAVGHASADEIDRIGIMAALRLAGMRALEAVRIEPDLVILDGNHDWLTAPEEVGLFAFAGSGPATPPVTTMIKADLKCSSVAAASVLAKVERDGIMVEAAREHPTYGWAENKGYAAPEHVAALEAEGPCVLHRRSWRLPGTMVEDGVGEAEEPDLRDGTPAEVLDDELAEVRYEALDETLGEGRHRGALDERDAG
ncbi:ribonuclease HII [Phycicoccus sp. SLBN-51]|uniref:ribonuclease HII n=1 Tax=Phycicoccus sp. SLBN-51 TaxID=2768447 RepID=UPI00114FCBF8|nr:ribonuclease HII [Phycicoccus sp. SLBN-51]TQJ50029.1 RNase HII [Phycicoccus sp. SLBN-51]